MLKDEINNFPLFCTKCIQKTLTSAKRLNISIITEPDPKTQGHMTLRDRALQGETECERTANCDKADMAVCP